jgi:hypothetical protein
MLSNKSTNLFIQLNGANPIRREHCLLNNAALLQLREVFPKDNDSRTDAAQNTLLVIAVNFRPGHWDLLLCAKWVGLVKFVNARPYADPEVAARKIIEIANEFEPVQDGRIYIEKINGPMLFQLKATPAEYKAGLDRAVEKGWLELHESGTFVKFTQAGADLFA